MIAFLDIGFGELVVVAVVGLVLYGGRLPEMMRMLGGNYRKLKRSVEDMTRQATTVETPRTAYRPEPPKAAEALPRPAPDAAPAALPTPTPATPSPPREDDAPHV